MALPRNRSAASSRSPGRRRARGPLRQPPATQRRGPGLSQVQRRQRLLFAIGGTLILVIFGIIAFGYYQEFYRPPRVMAGQVNNVRFSMGDLVQRIRVLQGLSGQVDLSVIPFEYLEDLLNAETLRQQGPLLGIAATEAEADQLLRAQFYPRPPAGQETDPGQLDQEFKQNFSVFLTRTGLSDADYRVILKESVALFKLRSSLGGGIKDPQEQVEVEWIRMETKGGSIDPGAVRKRLEKEEFATVAADVGVTASSPDPFADPDGYVGWVPRGAFPDLDDALFGEGDKPPLAVGAISDPQFSREGLYIVRKRGGPEERPLSDLMRAKLNDELVKKWQSDQRSRGSDEGWLKINFNSKLYAWVADQVRVSAPRTPRAPQGQGSQP